MKQITRIALLTSLGLSLAGSALAQLSNRAEKIPGYFNPKTRTFTARVANKAVADAATKTYTGTFEFKFTIKLDTGVASGNEVVCEASADTQDEDSGNFYYETAERKATISGSTATCVVPIPYSWALASESSDTVSLTYDIAIVPTTASAQTLTRDSEGNLNSIPIPTTGATTNLIVSPTI